MKFDPIDILLIAGIIAGGVLGYQAGGTKKLLTFLALIGSIVLAANLMTTVGSFFTDIVLISEPTGSMLGFAVVVLVIMVGILLLYRKFGSKSMPKSSSQMFGLVLGTFESAIIVSLLLLMFKLYDFPDKDTRADSLTYQPLVTLTPNLFDALRRYLPGAEAFRKELSSTFRKQNIFDEQTGQKKRL